MKFNGKVKIIEKNEIQNDVFQLVVERPSEITSICSGQFFNIVASNLGYPLLRRPISVSGYTSEKIEFTIKVLGKGTRALFDTRIGDYIELMGPLGNGFKQNNEEKILIIGGGIGVAPLKGLIENWSCKSTRIDAILGYRDQPFLDDAFEKNSDKVIRVSENDPACLSGYVTQPFLEMIEKNNYDMIFACGPEVMLRVLAKHCNDRGLPIQLLMEEKMACGIGACLVCTCKTKQGEFGYKHVRMCADGPMFFGSEVIFDEK